MNSAGFFTVAGAVVSLGTEPTDRHRLCSRGQKVWPLLSAMP